MNGVVALSLREAARGFTRQKSLFAVAVLTLVLGLSLCTTMVSILYGVILRPLPYGKSDRVVMAWAAYEGGGERETFDQQSLLTWRQATHVFDSLGAFRYSQFTLLQRGDPVSVQGAIVAPELFTALGVHARVGTVFTPQTALAEQGKLALLSYRLWRQRFAGDPAVVGTSIHLDDAVYTVTGVMPDDFDVPSNATSIWVPLPPGPPAARSLYVVGRLRDSVTLAQAQADADGVARRLASELADTHRGMRIHLVPFFDELVRDSRSLVLVGSAAALLVLLICCANVANLMLVRAIVRRSEFATRSAIGAQRRHLLGAILAEGLVLSACGGVVAAVLSRFMIAALLRLSPVDIPRAASVGEGWQIPLVSALLIAVATLLVSLPAAWDVARSELSLDAARGTRSTSRSFARQFIVTLEMAVALTLLVGSGLMARTVLALRDSNPGWHSDHRLVAQIIVPRRTYQTPPQMRQFFDTLIERLRGAPGVVSVDASSAVPAASFGVDLDLDIQVPGPAGATDGRAAIRLITPGFFQTLGIPLLQGRQFEEADGDPQARRIIVNQSFVRRHMKSLDSALGRQVTVFLGAPQAYEIIGVVGDVRHYGMLREAKPEFYLPVSVRPITSMGVVVRTAGDPLALVTEVRKQVAALDPELPIASLDTMDNLVKATWSDRTFLGFMMVFFAAAVVILTVVGVFSVVQFSVSRQVREIGIRMALGAHGDAVVRLVMGQSARTVAAGLVLGLAGAWVLGRGLANQMYGVSTHDPGVLLAGAAGVALVAVIGAWVPSRRAAAIDPAVALRVE